MTVPLDAATWVEANQRYLLRALAEVRASLDRRLAQTEGRTASTATKVEVPQDGEDIRLEAPAALERLCATFGLSWFERAVLLLCAGPELDSSFGELCAAAQGDAARSCPTFSLALAALDDPHWTALAPSGPLRHWRLIEIASQPGASLTLSPLRIDERILHYLAGVQHLDERLVGLVEPVAQPGDLVPSHAAVARRIASLWTGARGALPLMQLCGPDEASKLAIAAAGCAAVELTLFSLVAASIPANPSELEGFVRLWERESALTGSALYVDAHAIDMAESHAIGTVTRFLERTGSPLLLGTRDRWKSARRPAIALDVRKPTRDEQRETWRAVLAEYGISVNGQVDEMTTQFDLSAPAIRASVCEAVSLAESGEPPAEELWDAGRSQARPRLDTLARRIEQVATWGDLVLPETQRELLREVAAHVAHRRTVYDLWGFDALSSRGLGISALFAGPSGTGKTMAAEVLANDLRLDLYRIDLSSVVSKYIGETEKNLRQLFDAAEDGGAILFFDEADALFGKRSEVKDAHDRYANIEINYLLQRMEEYRGLAILATNRKSLLDDAFLRRLRFLVDFPFPDALQRVQIWRKVFPEQATVEALDFEALARLEIAGGNIRNIALNAAFLAAASGRPIAMDHVLHAARREYAKIDKLLLESEFGSYFGMVRA